MDRTFVLDTNVVLHDPRALFNFKDNHVVIPIYVVEEIDKFKKDQSELGRAARQVSRYLDQLREEGSLSQGVDLDQGGLLQVLGTQKVLPPEISTASGQDSRILALALDIKEKNQRPVVLITKDLNLRIRADAVGVLTENYDPERVEIEEGLSGCDTLDVSPEEVDTFYKSGHFTLPDPYYGPNEYLTLKDKQNPSHTALGRVRLMDKQLIPIPTLKQSVWGIRAKNKEQIFALDLLLDDSVKLVTLVGKAGTGKTLLAIAAGLHKVAEEKIYQRLLVSRPVFPMGKDLGYLPGNLDEKLAPWMQPIFDNVEFLMGLSPSARGSTKNTTGRSYKELIDMGLIQIEPLTYIRGRSIASQFMIVDEAQNLTPHEVKTIVSRAGEGTKIVLTGDPYQIDHPYVDSVNNGLVHTANRFKGEKVAGHMRLIKGERSELAELAANLL